jgi:hypothetical protein
MLLHASWLKFKHPVTEIDVEITATPHSEFKRVMQMMNFTAE